MSEYRFTPAARADLSGIWNYTVERWGVDQAETYLGEIRSAIERIAEDADRGRACGEIRQGYRRYGIGSHLVFLVAREDGVDVGRILRQWMDPSRHL